MNGSLKRISKLEESERIRLNAETNRIISGMTDEELALAVNSDLGGLDVRTLTDDQLRELIEQGEKTVSIAEMAAELDRLKGWLTRHRAGRMQGNASLCKVQG
jgi:hypothetical protein